MSNVINIEFTEFKDQHGSSFGYRIFDNYGSAYNNTYETMEDVRSEWHKDNFWEILDQHDEFEDALDSCSSICFNGVYYDPEEIQQKKLDIEQSEV